MITTAREKLPHRRRSWTRCVRIADKHELPTTFYLTVGLYPDGRPGELWIDASREGTFTRGVLAATARMASFALQCGAPLAEVVQSLRGLTFPPSGAVVGSAAVADCTSVMDWVAQELAAEYIAPPVPSPESVIGAGI